MLKYPMLAALAALIVAGPAKAETLYRGTLVYTVVNTSCPNGPTAGEIHTAQYHPEIVSGVAQTYVAAALNVYHYFGIIGVKINNAEFPVSKAGIFVTPNPLTPYGVGWSDYTPSPGSNLIVMSRTPATLSNKTPVVVMTGKIQNPRGGTVGPNCIASFEFTGILNTQK